MTPIHRFSIWKLNPKTNGYERHGSDRFADGKDGFDAAKKVARALGLKPLDWQSSKVGDRTPFVLRNETPFGPFSACVKGEVL